MQVAASKGVLFFILAVVCALNQDLGHEISFWRWIV